MRVLMKLSTGFGWFFGSLMILVGLYLTGLYFLTGIALAAAGLLWWPPSQKWLIEHLGLPPMPIFFWAITLCFLVVALFAFIGRYSAQLEVQAQEAGYSSVEEWRAARQQPSEEQR